MIRKILSIFIAAVLMTAGMSFSITSRAADTLPTTSWADAGNFDAAWLNAATGTEADPFMITTEKEFAALTQTGTTDALKGKHVQLLPVSGELDLSAHLWKPVWLEGAGAADDQFTFFYGNATTIKGLILKDSYLEIDLGNEYPEPTGTMGLFGIIKNARVSDINLDKPRVIAANPSGYYYGDNFISYFMDIIGTLAGYVENARLVYCDVIRPDVTVTSPTDTIIAGGAVGYAANNAFTASVVVKGGKLDVVTPNEGTVVENGAAVISNSGGYDKAVYIGGLAGYLYKSNVLNTASTADIVYENLCNGYINYRYIGGLIGASSTVNAPVATCVLNSFSGGSINVKDHSTGSVGRDFIGGLVGHLDDTAVNNYSYTSLTVDIEDPGSYYRHIGKLFGGVSYTLKYGTSEPEHEIFGNYYISGGDYDPVGGVLSNASLWNLIKDAATDEITSKSSLLTTLSAGVEDVITVMIAHTAGTPEAVARAYTENWAAYDGENEGYPLFVKKDASLKSLKVNKGDISPSFLSEVLKYIAKVPYDCTSVQLNAVTTDAVNAVIRINGAVIKSGLDTDALPLVQGDNTVTLVVTNRNARQAYEVNIQHLADTPPEVINPPTGDTTATAWAAVLFIISACGLLLLKKRTKLCD